MRNSLSRPFRAVVAVFDSHTRPEALPGEAGTRWALPVPFVLFNLAALFVFVVGVSWVAVATAIVLYVVRMFGITAGYHRYFSHRTYKASRAMQFVIAVVGNSAVQRGPLWWASHHRHHHAHSDTPEDAHSPLQKGGFWNSHMLWWGRQKYGRARLDLVKDLTKYPELVFLDRFDVVVPVLLGVATFLFGVALETWAPGLGTNGWQMLVWGFVVSTVVLFHGVATINSLSHVYGSRRFKTTDDSRNNFWLALITLGEGWHNNHHHYPNSTRQGFYWWEIDLSYYGLKLLRAVGLVRDLKPVPARVLADGRAGKPAPSPVSDVGTTEVPASRDAGRVALPVVFSVQAPKASVPA